MSETRKPADIRKQRLAKALKANIAKRKAQAQARIKSRDAAQVRPDKPQKS